MRRAAATRLSRQFCVPFARRVHSLPFTTCTALHCTVRYNTLRKSFIQKLPTLKSGLNDRDRSHSIFFRQSRYFFCFRFDFFFFEKIFFSLIFKDVTQKTLQKTSNKKKKKMNAETEYLSLAEFHDMRKSLEVAESLAKASMLTPPSAERRLRARQLELDSKDDPNGYVPPKHVLLYLVR